MFLKQSFAFFRSLVRVSTIQPYSINRLFFSANYNLSSILSNHLEILPQNSFQKRLVSNSSNVNIVETNSSTLVEDVDEAEDDILYKRIIIEARSADRGVLNSYEKFVSMAAKYLGINVVRIWEPVRTIKRRTLLRAAFVKKKYRVQYEVRTYYRDIEFSHLTGSTADTFLEYIERNLPEGTSLKVTRERIETIPPHIVPPNVSSS